MNRVYKLTPVSPYDVPGLESWLADMSRKGLHLKKFRPLFCTFTKGERKEIRYRVEAHRRILDDDLPASMIDLYGEFGWEFVCEVNRQLLIFAAEASEAPEIHSDPELQAEPWAKLRRSMTIGCVFEVLFLLFLLGLLAAAAVLARPARFFVVENGLFLLICTLFFALVLPSELEDRRLVARIVRQLREGIPLDHRTVYPKRRPAALLSFLGAVIIVAAWAVFQFILPFMSLDGAQSIDNLTTFTPLSLASVEGTGYVEDHFVANGVDYANFAAREDRALLCWEQWRVVQTGSINSLEDWHRMEIHWYDLAFDPLAVPLIKEEFDASMALDRDIWWTSKVPAGWSAEYFLHENADFLAVAKRQEGSFQIAAVAARDKAALVTYTGDGELAEHLDEIVGMVNAAVK